MNIEEMKTQIQSGLHLNDEVQILSEKDTCSIRFYVDLIKYGNTYSAKRQLNSGFIDDFNSLAIEKKAELAALDKRNILPAVLLSELAEDPNYRQWIGSQNLMIREMISAIAIVNADIDSIDKNDDRLLYQFFVNSRIKPENLTYFSKEPFVTSMLKKLLTEERVIFTWIVLNLIFMIQNSLLNPFQHRAFFIKLFNKEPYIQGELNTLFVEAVLKDPTLFEALTKCPLSIDPFTKQIDHSLWLRDSAKFLHLESWRDLNGTIKTEQVTNFERKLNTFKEINKYDRSLR